jgi:hypothetical protein
MTDSTREEEVPRAVIEAAELNAIEGGGLTPDFCVGPLPPVRPKPPWWPPCKPFPLPPLK